MDVVRSNIFYLAFCICFIISCKSDDINKISKVMLNGKAMGTSYSVSYVSDSVVIDKKSIETFDQKINKKNCEINGENG